MTFFQFTGSYSYTGFRSCIAVNPWDARGTAAAIHQALTMSDEEARSRWEDLYNHVITQSAQAFVTSFLTRCLRANEEHVSASASGNNRLGLRRGGHGGGGGVMMLGSMGRSDSSGYMSTGYLSPVVGSSGPSTPGVGIGGGRGVDDDDSIVPSLSSDTSLNALKGRWKHSERRLVLIDWEGTILPSKYQYGVTDEERERKKKQGVECLELLTKSGGKNEVWVLSGYTQKVVEEGLGDVNRRVGIV
jgi:hypothetical protein